MKAYDLKQYIIDNEKTRDILEWLECHHIKSYKKIFSFGLPDSKNPNSTCIYKHSLKTIVYSKSNELKGDIFTLTMNIKNITFPQSVKEIHKILGLPYTINIDDKEVEIKKIDILEIFKKAQRKHYNNSNDNLDIYNEEILREFVPIPYIEWVREGIMPYTQKEFGIGYSRLKNRVCIPWRYWCGNPNQYTGIIGRTLEENYKALGIPKYFPLISFPKSMNIYGLQENYKHIQEAGSVTVFEAEKSTLKAHSLNIKNCVSIGGHELSDEHIKILLSLDVEIIFAMDKDMEEQLSIDMCNKVKTFRKTGYIFDEYNLLKEKDSPMDHGLKVFKALLKRIKYIN